jgi:hypothetical protein
MQATPWLLLLLIAYVLVIRPAGQAQLLTQWEQAIVMVLWSFPCLALTDIRNQTG